MTRPERSQDMELRQTNLASRRHPALRPMIAYSRDVRVGKQAGHSFGEVSLVGKSRAVVGDQYGDTFNIEKATFSTSALSATAEHDGSCKVVRHNQIFPTYTLETVLRIQDGGIIPMRGSTSEMELRWERRNFLGAGVFGEVYREDCNVNASYPRSRAVKVLRRRQLEKLKIDYRRELDAWMCLSQPDYIRHFVEFYSWYENENNIYLAMEFLPFGDLSSYIMHGIDENDARQVACQVLEGMRIMHRLDFIHRDLKPENVFVVQERPAWWVKIGDFSICKSTIVNHTTLHTNVGTVGYQAPEILGFVPTEKKNHYNAKCDVWSFGCLVYKMLTSRLPFENTQELLEFCRNSPTFPVLPLQTVHASGEASDLVRRLLIASPASRPSSDNVASLGHSWFHVQPSHPQALAMHLKNDTVMDSSFRSQKTATSSSAAIPFETRSVLDVRRLYADIDGLAADARIECTREPTNRMKAQKLKTLIDLKVLVQRTELDEQDLQDIRDTISLEMKNRNLELLDDPILGSQMPSTEDPDRDTETKESCTSVADTLSQITCRNALPSRSDSAASPQYGVGSRRDFEVYDGQVLPSTDQEEVYDDATAAQRAGLTVSVDGIELRIGGVGRIERARDRCSREMRREAVQQPSSDSLPLDSVQLSISPWNPGNQSGLNGKPWTARTRRKADAAWIIEHERRLSDLDSISQQMVELSPKHR